MLSFGYLLINRSTARLLVKNNLLFSGLTSTLVGCAAWSVDTEVRHLFVTTSRIDMRVDMCIDMRIEMLMYRNVCIT